MSAVLSAVLAAAAVSDAVWWRLLVQDVILLAGFVAAAGVLYKMVIRPLVREAREEVARRRSIDHIIASELTTNGGTSIKDHVTAMEARVSTNDARLDAIQRDTAATRNLLVTHMAQEETTMARAVDQLREHGIEITITPPDQRPDIGPD